MTLKINAECEEKLPVAWRNVANFRQSTWDYDGILLSKVENA